MPDKFILTIELGNDAMQTEMDIANALREIASRITLTGKDGGVIRDENGNTVGSWVCE
jgi:hypothetical protein